MSPYTYDKTLRESLYMLLIQCPAEEILNRWASKYCGHQTNISDVFTLLSRTLSTIHPERFSLNDAQQLFSGLKEQYFSNEASGISLCILDFAEQTLTLEGELPEIKFEEVLRWRDTTHPIGTIPFLTAFLAYEDLKHQRNRINYAFNPILSTNNRRLKFILSNGMAENHFHLNGSAPSFMISWIRLMNEPVFDSKDWREFAEILGESGHHALPNWETLLFKAAVIRALLFYILTEPQSNAQCGYNPKVPSDLVMIFLDVLLNRKLPQQTSNDILAALKVLYKMQNINSMGDTWGVHDYAVTLANIPPSPEDVAYMIFSGEMRFQYMVFQALFQKNSKILPFHDLFYAYLAIQCQFRSELIENDHRFGLENFCRYDHRKKAFFDTRDRKIQKAIPILEHLSDSRVLSLEARIVPDIGATSLKAQITSVDSIIREELSKTTFAAEKISDLLQRLHYILHFVKETDAPFPSAGCASVYRHKSVRDKFKKIADGIISLRENDRDTALRISGIDGCSNEIYMRPEVFAPEFRRLKNHTPKLVYPWLSALPPLYMTYHVGEDFLDVTDGLRAIWESVTFLEMDRTSRIGHGLVLGIDVKEWYLKKQFRVYLSCQALLDNCVWLLKFLDLNGKLESGFRYELLQYIETLFAKIYQDECEHNPFSLDSYWNAMQLRGDNPEIYCDIMPWEQYLNTLDIQSVINPYALRDNNPTSLLNSIRRFQPASVRLYHRYHYDPHVRQRGNESVEFHITVSMVKGVTLAQTVLRNCIAQKGIGIETNPSSNVLIGNFNRYEKHPIFVFNDSGLFNKPDTPNISVSINTDDQGIFDTSLENEYALLARALEQMHDETGNPIVDQDHIYGWLDHVRKMGISQSFYWNPKA